MDNGEPDDIKRTPLLLSHEEKIEFAEWLDDASQSLTRFGLVIEQLTKRLDMLEDIQQSQAQAALEAVGRSLNMSIEEIEEAAEKEERGERIVRQKERDDATEH